ncbi:2OG-Fe(II) oxygenase [Acetobacter musti]|uniref:2OG-Fe(II) oxygenase n=1 Tax=Acetobacter musti TaxID=864732 RepID=A0ABX0JVA4_9PROT|nr:2OG-Fe(II) oxygenase [Acetobacter musti]NHN86749.1 2OG-Fe(II) oxygenase [Acetobacter musti]
MTETTQTRPGETSACAAAIENFRRTVAAARASDVPFRHWTLDNVIPGEACEALVAWEPAQGSVAGDTGGRRETRNGARVFVEPGARNRDPRLDVMARMFDSPEAREAITGLCGTSLEHTALRLELSLDTDGFWLEPHTDIGAKKLTLLIPLSVAPDAGQWGTDLMNAEGESVVRSSGRFNTGTLFVPGDDTWHGFVRRPIDGLRRGLIVNFVDSTWRATHELAFGPAL